MAKTLPCELSLSQCFLSPGVGAVLQPGEMDAQKVMEGAGQGPQVCSRVRCQLSPSASKVVLKILQARLQQYVNREISDVQAAFRKDRGIRDQISNIRWIMEKGRELQKNIYFCFIDYAKAFDCVDHNKL